jgi:hypothetical protein
LEWIFSQHRKVLTNRYKVIIYAFNGAKYDTQFVLKSKRLHFQEIIDSQGILKLTLEGGYVEFRDSMRMTGTSTLAKLCKDFGLSEENRKTYFPHQFATYSGFVPFYKKQHPEIPEQEIENNWKNYLLNYEGEIPEEFWEGNPIRNTFNFKKDAIFYNKLDNISQCIIMEKLRSNLLNKIGLDIFDFLTAPQLAVRYLLMGAPPKSIFMCSEHPNDAWLRSSIQGGRCFPQRGYFISEDEPKILEAAEKNQATLKILEAEKNQATLKILEAEKNQATLKTLYENCNDFMDDLDATSLYASAMANYDYPSSPPQWEHDEQKIIDGLNNQDSNLPLAIVECEIFVPEGQICPLLSYKLPDGRLRYYTGTLKITKNSVDIMEAVRYNQARVLRIFNAMVWLEKAPIFRERTNTLFEMRKQAKEDGNDALQATMKLILCSGYGKFVEKLHEEKTKIISENETINKIYQNNAVPVDETLANKEQCLIKYVENRLPVIKVPLHIGSFILAYARKIMNQAIDGFGGFTNWNKTFYYTDTDSLYVHHKQYLELQKNHPELIGKELGQLKDDLPKIKNGKIIKAIFVSPKLYIIEYVGIDDDKESKTYGQVVVRKSIRAKGIKKEHHHELTMDTFYEMLYEHKVVEIKNISRFAKNLKKTDEPAVKTVITAVKKINKDVFSGRKWNAEVNRFESIVFGSEEKWNKKQKIFEHLPISEEEQKKKIPEEEKEYDEFSDDY